MAPALALSEKESISEAGESSGAPFVLFVLQSTMRRNMKKHKKKALFCRIQSAILEETEQSIYAEKGEKERQLKTKKKTPLSTEWTTINRYSRKSGRGE